MNTSTSPTHLTICTFATRGGVPGSVAFEHLTGSYVITLGQSVKHVSSRGRTASKRLAAALKHIICDGRAAEETFVWSHTGARGDVCCRRIERELEKAHGLI